MTPVSTEPSDRRREPLTRSGGGSAVALPLAPASPGELVARAREALRTGYWARLVPLLGALAVLTHLPSFSRPFWSPDEGFLASEARMLSGGGQLYNSVVDRKPPLLPWLYEAAFWLFGSSSLWPLRVLAIGAHLGTAVLLAAIARQRWGNRAGAAAGVLYLLVSIGLSPEDSQAATFEVFMLPATAAAFWFAQNRRWAQSGVAAAAAALTKQTGGAVLFAVLWMLRRESRRYGGESARTSLPSLAFGFGLPVMVIALSTGLRNFAFWVITGSSDYASLDGGWLTMLERSFGNAAILASAALALLVPLARRWRRVREDADLWVWFGASCLGVITGFHFFGHYYLQVVPPLVLLGVGAVARGAANWRPVLLYTALAGAVFTGLGFVWPQQPFQHSVAVATDVAEETSPHDTVLVWGMDPEVYWLSDRAPATRYLSAGLLTDFAGGREASSVGVQHAVPGSWTVFHSEMEHRLPALIVDESGDAPYAPRYIQPLRALITAHYVEIGHDGTAVFYMLRHR